MSRRLRNAISRRLPASFLLPIRRSARLFDQLTGRVSASKSPGIIAMFHIGRCGSTVLGNLLDQHEKIFWDGEIYYQQWQEADLKLEPFDNSNFVKRRALSAGSRYYGFDIKFLEHQHLAIAQLELNKLISEFKKSGATHFIILRRENHLRTLISWMVGRARKQHHIRSQESATETRVKLKVEGFSFGVVPVKRSLVEWFQHIDESYSCLLEELRGQHVLEISYENDIRDNPQVAYQRCCKFLKVGEAPAEVQFSRTNPFPVHQLLENPDEVREALKGSSYEWMLDE